jgi:myxalamid-type polyketide synthase MxaB
MFTPSQGIAALEKILTLREVQVGVSEVTDWNVIKSVFRQGQYFDELKSDRVDDDKFEPLNNLVDGINAATTADELYEKVSLYVKSILKRTLNLSESETLDVDQNFSELGVDSLMAMEMRNHFQTVVGEKTLSLSALQENKTIKSLSTYLVSILHDDGLVHKSLSELVTKDIVLPPEIQAADTRTVKPSEFSRILLTGNMTILH